MTLNPPKPSKEREVLYKDVVGRKIKITCNSFAPDWIHQKGKKAEIIDYTGEDMYLIRVINSEKEPHKFYLSKKDFEFIVPNPKTSMESRFEIQFARSLGKYVTFNKDASVSIFKAGDMRHIHHELLAFIKAELAKRDKKWEKRLTNFQEAIAELLDNL